jgi:hypothetical protein
MLVLPAWTLIQGYTRGCRRLVSDTALRREEGVMRVYAFAFIGVVMCASIGCQSRGPSSVVTHRAITAAPQVAKVTQGQQPPLRHAKAKLIAQRIWWRQL